MDIAGEIRNDPEKGARLLESEYKAGLTTLARRLCADEGDAEELVNRTFAEVVRSIDTYLEQSAFFGWMCQILVNLRSKDLRRKSNRTVAVTEGVDELPDEDSPARLFRDVDASLLRDAVQSLPGDMREAVVLRYFMDLPLRRMAKILCVPEGTVNSRLHYARLALAAKLGAATRKPGGRMLLLGLLLAAGLAVGGGLYTLGTAVFESHAENAESAEIESHAENAESAEIESHAENAEMEPHAESGGGSGEAEPPPVVRTLSTTTPYAAMNAKTLLAAASLALAAAPVSVSAQAQGNLVGLWTFARENPLEAKVGPDALEATGRHSLATSATTNALYAVTDAAALDGRAGVLAAPVSSGIALPIAGNLSTDWCLTFDFRVPVYADWVSLFQLNQNNTGDSSLYLKNGSQIGLGQYDTVGTASEVVGRWHQVVVSCSAGQAYVWFDGSKIDRVRNWNLSGLSWIVLGIDGGGDDNLIWFDEARLYDGARPADVFPDGENAAVFAPDRDDGAPVVALGRVSSRYGSVTLPVSVLSPGDEACSLAAVVAPDGGEASRFALAASAAAGSQSFEIPGLGWATGASGTVFVEATGLSRGRTAASAAQSFRFSTGGAAASLVGHWTFSRDNPLEAKVGQDALEGTGRSPVATSATTNALYGIGDAAVLGDRVGVLAIPKGAGALLPVPEGVVDTWCLSFDFYVPQYFQWFSFFSLTQSNNQDGWLFLRNGTDIGLSTYHTLNNFVGSWHQLVISMDGGTGTLWCDGTKLAQSRSWTLPPGGWILLSMDNDGDDNLLYFDEVRLYDEARPGDVFPDGANATVYAPDRDDGTPSVSLGAVSYAGGTLSLSVAVDDPGDDACSLSARIAGPGGTVVERPLAASAGGGTHAFDVALGDVPAGAYSVSVVATGLSRGKSATSAEATVFATDPAAAVFGEAHDYAVSVQRLTATGTLETLGEGENTLYLLATGTDGVTRSLASQAVAEPGAFSLSGLFPGRGSVEARVVCSNSVDGAVWHVAALPAATLALGSDTSRYHRAAGAAAVADWNDPAAWTGGLLNTAGFPTADSQTWFDASGAATTTRLPAGTWTAGEMHFEAAGVTNVFAGEGMDVSFLDTSMWFWGEGDYLGISNATFRCDGFGFRAPDMTIRVDGGRLAPMAAVDLGDTQGPRARLELVNGGLVETFAEFRFGAEDSVLFVDGGAFRSQGALSLQNGGATIDVAIPEAPPAEALVSVATMSRPYGASYAFAVNIVENRSKTPGLVPVLACSGGIPDGLVELGSVPYPERRERLFFGYDGTAAETGTLRTGVWYRSNPVLPTLILIR